MLALIFAGFRLHPKGGAWDLIASADLNLDAPDGLVEIIEGLQATDREVRAQVERGLHGAAYTEAQIAHHLAAYCDRWAQVVDARTLLPVLEARCYPCTTPPPLLRLPTDGAPHDRYLGFAGSRHTPLGGILDAQGSSDSCEEAQHYCRQILADWERQRQAQWAREGHRPAEVAAMSRSSPQWAHVYDREADAIVWQC